MQSINQSINQSKSSVKTFVRLSSTLAIGMALFITSNQSAATIYTSLSSISSASDFTAGSKWGINVCTPAPSPVGGTIVPTATDYFVICNGYSLTFPAGYIIPFQRLAFNTSGTRIVTGKQIGRAHV